MDIEDIRDAIASGRYRVTRHADAKAQGEGFELIELTGSGLIDELIELYPDDTPLPSCLIYGRTPSGAIVHTVWGYNAGKREAVLITLYRPDPNLWIDWRIRRSRYDGSG